MNKTTELTTKQELSLHQRLAIIQKELKAPKAQVNKFGGFNYRSCEDILEALKPYLDGLTIIISDDIVNIGERYYVKATATLSDGKSLILNTAYAREPQIKKGMDESQITGATSSYARKYALNGLLALDDTKDADFRDNTESTPKVSKPNQPADSAATENTPDEEHFCKIHNKPLKQRTSKHGSHFYSHGWQEEGVWKYCSGRPQKEVKAFVKSNDDEAEWLNQMEE